MSCIVGATLAVAQQRAEALVLSTIEGSPAPTTCGNPRLLPTSRESGQVRPEESFKGFGIEEAEI
jgi:hypothetical protein